MEEKLKPKVRSKGFKSENISIGKIILPIRLSISGFGIGPSLYALMELLTKKTVLRRIKYAIDNFPIGL